MLLQSHAGYINILPAIPDQWKSEGEVKGLKARGNFMVDFKWKDVSATSK
jgi:alpha-L-fucosidase 2